MRPGANLKSTGRVGTYRGCVVETNHTVSIIRDEGCILRLLPVLQVGEEAHKRWVVKVPVLGEPVDVMWVG